MNSCLQSIKIFLLKKTKNNNIYFNFLKRFLEDTCPFLGPLIPCFGLLVTSALGFKARVDIACTLACLGAIPQIHLWCDTCRPLDGQHGGPSRSLHASAEVGCQGSNGGSPAQSTDALPTRPPRRATFISNCETFSNDVGYIGLPLL